MGRQYGALCGLAMVLVVLNHVFTWGVNDPQGLGWYRPVSGFFGYVLLVLGQIGPAMAVATFLFISSCFVTYAAHGNPPKLTYRTILTRLKRVLLPYLVWSVVFYIVIYFQWGRTYTLAGYVKNVLVGYPYNFVPLLIFFYVLSPIFIRLDRRMRWAIVAMVGVYQLILINMVYPGLFGFTFPSAFHVIELPVLSATIANWGVFFPMGLAYSMDARAVLPWLRKVRWMTGALALVFFAAACLDAAGVLRFPLGNLLCALSFTLFIPTVKREGIPLAHYMEEIGKRSYGIYLSHLIVLDLTVYAIQLFAPWLIEYQVLLKPFLFAIALGIPIILMSTITRLPVRQAYRVVFG